MHGGRTECRTGSKLLDMVEVVLSQSQELEDLIWERADAQARASARSCGFGQITAETEIGIRQIVN